MCSEVKTKDGRKLIRDFRLSVGRHPNNYIKRVYLSFPLHIKHYIMYSQWECLKKCLLKELVANHYDPNGNFDDRIVNISVLDTRVNYPYVSPGTVNMVIDNEYSSPGSMITSIVPVVFSITKN